MDRQNPALAANAQGAHYKLTPKELAHPRQHKRYGGSRLYDTSKAKYVTVDELREWRERGIAFEVRQAVTGEDVSRVLLA